MPKNTFMVVTDVLVEEKPVLSLDELCLACHVTPDFIQDLIDYGIIELTEEMLLASHFSADHLRRVKTVIHLQKDLEINLAGAALVLDLMDEMDEMRRRLDFFEKNI